MSNARLTVVLAFFTCTAFAGWEPIPSLPSPNGGFACGTIGGKLVIIGGTNWKENTKHWLDVIWTYRPGAAQWEIQGTLPHPLAYAVAVEAGGDLIIAGGSDGKLPRKEIWLLKPSGELTRAGDLAEPSAAAMGGVVDEESFVVFGGCADPGNIEGLLNRGERVSLRGKPSTLLLPLVRPASLGAGVGANGELFIFGGATHDASGELVNLSDAWSFVANAGKWRKLQPYPFGVRGAAGVRLEKQKLLVAGGFGGKADTFTSAAFCYDTQRNQYAKTLDLPVAGLVGLARLDDFVYCLGGEDKMKHRSAACARVSVKELLEASKP